LTRLYAALKKVLSYTLRESGNLKNRLSKMPIEDVLDLADSSYPKSEKKQDIYTTGLNLGREAKQKIVYRIVLRDYVVYFIGSEADIIKRIEDYKTMKEEEGVIKEESGKEGKDKPTTQDSISDALEKIDKKLKELL